MLTMHMVLQDLEHAEPMQSMQLRSSEQQLKFLVQHGLVSLGNRMPLYHTEQLHQALQINILLYIAYAPIQSPSDFKAYVSNIS